MIKDFKIRIKPVFDVSWEAEAFLKDKSKLDFYFSLKKTFGYKKIFRQSRPQFQDPRDKIKII